MTHQLDWGAGEAQESNQRPITWITAADRSMQYTRGKRVLKHIKTSNTTTYYDLNSSFLQSFNKRYIIFFVNVEFVADLLY